MAEVAEQPLDSRGPTNPLFVQMRSAGTLTDALPGRFVTSDAKRLRSAHAVGGVRRGGPSTQIVY